MSVLGVFYKVDGFPLLARPTESNMNNKCIASKGSDITILGHTESTSFTAVPIGVNLTRVQKSSKSGTAIAQCCTKQCLSKVDQSDQVAIQEIYYKMSTKIGQMRFLKSLVNITRGSDVPPRGEPTSSSEPARVERQGPFTVPTYRFSVPSSDVTCVSRDVCRTAFRYIFNIPVKTLDSLLARMLQEQYPDMLTRIEAKPNKPAICDKCGRTFARLSVMKRHREVCNRQRLPAKKCRYENCTQRFHHISRLAAHMKEVHNANIKPEQLLKFKNFQEFLTWKHLEEIRTFSLFVQKSGTRKCLESKVIHFSCQPGGRSKSNSRECKPTKRVKYDTSCIACMKAEVFNSGQVHVLYASTHSHPLQLRNVVKQTNNSTVKITNKKLQKMHSPKKLETSFQEKIFADVSTNNQEHMELGNQYGTSTLSNGKPSSVQNFCPDDSRAAEQLVAQLQALEPSPVIISSNTDEGFLLVLHLNCQANLLQNYLHLNKDVVFYMSSLEDCNNWGLILFSLLIEDELAGCVPVGFCLSKLPWPEAITKFFHALESRYPNMWSFISVIVVLPQLKDAVRSALDSLKAKTRLLLSVRHTLAAMHSQLSLSTSCCLTKQQISACVSRLVAAKDKAAFLEEVKRLFALCASTDETSAFWKEFDKKYIKQPTEWALCVRDKFLQKSMLHSCEYGESFHNLLLKYQKTHPLKRVDDFISSIIDVVTNYYSEGCQQNWREELTQRQYLFSQGASETDIDIIASNLPDQWEANVEGKQVYITSLSTSEPKSVPAPLDYFCSCSDPLPLCSHSMSVHAMCHTKVSNILIPKPSVVASDVNHAVVIEIECVQDKLGPARKEYENVCPTKSIPDINNISVHSSDVLKIIKKFKWKTFEVEMQVL